jgi:hypothetical protein
MNKRLALLLILILTTSSLIVVKPTHSSITKPSVPEFTLKFVEHSFDVAPTTTIDPYTGKNVTIQAGYRVQNRSIEVIIKNQPFTPYEDSNGNYIDLYYNVSSKGHYENNWYYYPPYLRQLPIIALDNDYTVLSFGLDVYYNDQYAFWLGDISAGGQVDFQVQALVGYYTYPLYDRTLEYNVFTGETSDWSNTQTLTIPTSTPSPTSSPSTSTPDQTTEPTPKEILQTLQLRAIIGTVIAVVVVDAGLLVYFKKHQRDKSPWRR